MNQEYMKKFVTPEEAAKAVKSGDWVDFGFGTGFPELFDRALAGRAGELSDVKVRGGLVYAPKIEILEADPEHKAFTWYSWHIGGYERKKQAEGQIRFVPMLLRQVPFLYRQHFQEPLPMNQFLVYCKLVQHYIQLALLFLLKHSFRRLIQ